MIDDLESRALEDTDQAPKLYPSTFKIFAVFIVVGTLYFIACKMPVMLDGIGRGWGKANGPGPLRPVPGAFALMMGWFPPYTIAWSANLFLLVGISAYARRATKLAMRCGFLALGTSLTTICIPFFQHPIQLADGYYVWQLSILFFAAAAWSTWHQKALIDPPE